MSEAPLPAQEEDDLLAAEYVLGVLDLPERGLAEARARRDPDFARRVTAWESRLGGLNEEFAPAPAPDLLPALEARLFARAAPAPRRGWQGGLFGMVTAAALALVAFAVLVPPLPDYIATLSATAADPLRYEASISGRNLTITRAAGTAAEAGQVHELWLIAGDAAPLSLGLIEGEALTVALPDQALAPGLVLAITLEPTGGGPGGKPSGPVIASGALEQS